MAETIAAVSATRPPWIVRTVVNPLFRALLATPAYRLLDRQFVVLHLTGRTTGRRYAVVLTRHDLDGVVTLMTSSPWRVNLRGGADVDITAGGRTRPARAVLIEDPDRVAAAYARETERLGWQGAQLVLGIRIGVDRAPTTEEFREAVLRENLSLIEVTPR